MSTVNDLMDEGTFADLLDAAEERAEGEWEENFVSDMRSRFYVYEERTYVSDRQMQILKRIAEESE